MAFGFKVRKVNMMRGNRQGNNAFLEDSIHEYQTPSDYLIMNEFCHDKCFSQDTVCKDTLLMIKKCLGEAKFNEFLDKALPVILRHGCFTVLSYLFEMQGHDNDHVDSIFNNVFYELLSSKEDCKIKDDEMRRAKLNKKACYAHVAALNPSGKGLAYLI
jgi:hypothetical protein